NLPDAAELAFDCKPDGRKYRSSVVRSATYLLSTPAPQSLRRILYAASQDCCHNLPRACRNALFERSPGAVSTYESGFESGKNGQVHGSAAGERLGTCSQLGKPLLGQRSRLRLVDNLHWQGSQGGLGGLDSLGNRRRPRSTNRNCGQRIV